MNDAPINKLRRGSRMSQLVPASRLAELEAQFESGFEGEHD